MNEHQHSPEVEIANLIVLHLQGTLNAAQQKKLNDWLAQSPENRALFAELAVPQVMDKNILAANARRRAEVLEQIYAKSQRSGEPVKRTNSRTLFTHIVQAATVAVLIIAASYVAYRLHWFGAGMKGKGNYPAAVAQDIAPGSNKALLVLGDGEQLELSGNKDSSFVRGAAVHLGTQGLVSYQQVKTSAAIEYHRLITPRGGDYHLQLSDGTGVWLNAASSIRFPAQFSGDNRTVWVTGEAYFEVAKDAAQPFTVKAEGMDIQVLGTAFNVKAYDPAQVQATLLNGLVRVKGGQGGTLLQPGKAAVYDGERLRVNAADTLTVTAWRKGVFRFRKTSMKDLMAEIERWYDVKVVFGESYDQLDQYNGEVPKSLPLSKVLETISETGIAHFTLEQRTIYVTR